MAKTSLKDARQYQDILGDMIARVEELETVIKVIQIELRAAKQTNTLNSRWKSIVCLIDDALVD